MFPASVSSLCAISVALLVVEPLGSARAIEVPSSRSVDVRSFGATGDGKTDDTTTVQTAIDACKPGDILLFPKGRFLVKSVVLKAGVYYLGKEAVIARPADHQPGWTRTFTTSYASDEDSALTTLEGLTFDGNPEEPRAVHQVRAGAVALGLLGSRSRPTRERVRALVKNCPVLGECVADGLSVYTNVDVQVQDCSSYNCFRGGFVLTGRQHEGRQ